jgi:pimeloyl-ACP methyl ester carboxylesterase
MTVSTTTIQLGRGFQPNPVLVNGRGTPVVYLHGLLGQRWDPFLEGLSATHRVFAPANVGSDEPEELQAVDGMHDLMIYYDEVFEKLGITQFDLIGHSFGGMVAAEFAAMRPDRVRKLVLIDPLGLWRDDAPVGDHLLVTAKQQTEFLLGDASSEAVRARLALPEDPAENVKLALKRITSMASVTHFIHPIPERGLNRRIHRIQAKSLIVWGANDTFVPKIYADDFATLIPAARVEIIEGAGHEPQFDKCEEVLALVNTFID